jgi:hypothetical protein
MSRTAADCEQIPPVTPASLAAFQRGYLLAEKVIAYLGKERSQKRSATTQSPPLSASPELLMELASVRIFNDWLESRLCDHFPAETEAALAALDKSTKALDADPDAFDDMDGLPPLTDVIFGIWSSRFAWNGLLELKADVLLQVSEDDENRLLNELADLLWEFRPKANRSPGS